MKVPVPSDLRTGGRRKPRRIWLTYIYQKNSHYNAGLDDG